MWDGRPGHPALYSSEAPVRVLNAWPGIIDRETFDLVQQKLEAKRPVVIHPRTVPSYYLLSGFLFCSCGRAMTGHSAKSGRHFYYLCSRTSKQGKDACNARMLPKEKVERLVIDQLRAKVPTDENLEELVTLVNEELQLTSSHLRERLDIIDAELRDVGARLRKLYDALETGKLELDNLAPRIKELKARQNELTTARMRVEVEMVAHHVQEIDLNTVKTYAQDLQSPLDEADITERKAFLRSFIKRIEVGKDKVKVCYDLPLPQAAACQGVEVLPIDTFGGAQCTISRTFTVAFEMAY